MAVLKINVKFVIPITCIQNCFSLSPNLYPL